MFRQNKQPEDVTLSSERISVNRRPTMAVWMVRIQEQTFIYLKHQYKLEKMVGSDVAICCTSAETPV